MNLNVSKNLDNQLLSRVPLIFPFVEIFQNFVLKLSYWQDFLTFICICLNVGIRFLNIIRHGGFLSAFSFSFSSSSLFHHLNYYHYLVSYD